ncbi:MAG TPA: DUF4160 domain-containing protein [Acidobacteriaceae bacterium]
MPTVLRIGPYRFFFYSEEGAEPPHVHIEAAERRAKYWLHPTSPVRNDGFCSGELKEIEKIILDNLVMLLKEWYEFFPDK